MFPGKCGSSVVISFNNNAHDGMGDVMNVSRSLYLSHRRYRWRIRNKAGVMAEATRDFFSYLQRSAPFEAPSEDA